MPMAVAALGELTRLFPINQLKLTGLTKFLMWPSTLREATVTDFKLGYRFLW